MPEGKGLVRQENERLRSCLLNWKFGQASQYLRRESEEVKNIVQTLKTLFGNCGWFDGDMGTIVAAVVVLLIGNEWKEG